MTTLTALSTRFDTDERPAGNILDAPGILAQAIAATNFYAGYAVLAANFAAQIAQLPVMVMPSPVNMNGFSGFYAGYATLGAVAPATVPDQTITAPTAYPEIAGSTDLTVSEWALIRPLFLLYVERENAIQLEASRGMGIDPFGRSSSEVAGDIVQMELGMPHSAALSLAFSI